MKYLLAVISLMTIAGCASHEPENRIAKGTRICVSIKADDVLSSVGVANESDVRGTAIRIKKYLLKTLGQRGITTCDESSFKSDDAKVTVTISTIETVTHAKPGPFFSTIVDQKCSIKYAASLVSEGRTVFEYDDDQNDESLDKVTEAIADHVGERVAKNFVN